MTTEETDDLRKHVDERFDNLRLRIEEIGDEKQDKLPRGTVLTILAAFVGQIILLAFVWGSQSQQLEDATKDRYTGTEARKDQAIVMQRFGTVETDILDNEVTMKELRARIRALEAHAQHE